MQRLVQMPSQEIRSLANLTTVDKENRRIEVVWSTGARGLRKPWFSDPYYEELSLKPEHVRMDRLNAGASVLDNHDSYSGLDSVLGVVQSASLHPEVNEARAWIKFSDRDEIRGKVDDIMNGIIRNLSVGYMIHKLVEVGRDGETPILRAEDWEPYELSFVTIPFDHKSQSRSVEQFSDCTLITAQREEKMDETNDQTVTEQTRSAPAAPAQKPIDLEAVKREAIEADRQRSAGILSAVTKAGLSRDFADKLTQQGVTLDQARELIIDELAAGTSRSHTTQIQAGAMNEGDTALRSIEESINIRIAPDFNKPTELSQRHRSSTLLDLCKSLLAVRGVRVENLSKSEVVQRAFQPDYSRGAYHTTSDFGGILGNSVKKILQDSYNVAPADIGWLSRRVGMTDYKGLTSYGLSTGPGLLEVKEHGEYQRGTLAEHSEFMKLKKHGRILALTREAIINDDLNAFSDIPRRWAGAANSLKTDLVIGQLLGNPVMGDGKTLFHADHGNVAASGAALSIPAIGEAVSALENQRAPGQDGEPVSYLRLRARYLLVPPALKGLALQLTTQITPNLASSVNPYAYLEVKSDPTLTGSAWYVIADLAGGDGIAELYMIGEDGPQLDQRQGFDVDGVEFKIRLDTGAKALDWRPFYKNPGVA